jgi:hypothetical protein
MLSNCLLCSSLADFSTLKIETTRSSETSVLTRPTRRHIPEDAILQTHNMFPNQLKTPGLHYTSLLLCCPLQIIFISPSSQFYRYFRNVYEPIVTTFRDKGWRSIEYHNLGARVRNENYTKDEVKSRINLRNTGSHIIYCTIINSRHLPESIENNKKTVILSFVFCGGGGVKLSLVLSEEQNLGTNWNRTVRRMPGPDRGNIIGGRIKLRKEEFLFPFFI